MKKRLIPVALLVGVAAVAAGCGSSSSSSSSTSAGGGSSAAGGGASSGGAASSGGSTSSGGSNASFLDGGFPAAATPAKGGRLHVAFESNIDCWNGLSYYGVSWSFFYAMARGLYGYPNTYKEPDTDTVRPDLAADMPAVSADGKTYTVKLRSGLVFNNGQPVTAKDVKATYEYMLDPNIQCSTGGPPSSGYYANIVGYAAYDKAMKASKGKTNPGISGIKVVDPQTVSFTLTGPDGSFLRALAMGWSFIRPASTPHKNTDTPPPFVGPYKVTSYVVDKSLKIDRDTQYWSKDVAAGVPEGKDENNIDGIDVEIGVPGDIQLQRLENNTLDLAMDGGAPVGSDVPKLAADPTYKDRYFSTPDAAVSYGLFRMDKAPFDNVKLRQAVNYAIDRTAIMKIAGGKLLREPWSQILSRNLIGNEPTDLYPATADPDTAKKLVQESGVPTPINIELAYNNLPPTPDEAASIKENLEAVGFKVTLKALTSDIIYGYYNDPKSTWALGLAGWGEDYADAITYFKPLLYSTSSSNYGHFNDPAFDKAVDTINQLPPGTDRYNQYAKLSTDTMKNSVPWWPTLARRQVNLVSTHVGNFYWAPGKQWYFGSYFVKP